MTGPWTDVEPAIANAYSSRLCIWKARCVSRRWKPTVTPNPAIRYITPKAMRSVTPTSEFHSSTTATRNATKGRRTAIRLTVRSALVMAWRLCTIKPRRLSHGQVMGAENYAQTMKSA